MESLTDRFSARAAAATSSALESAQGNSLDELVDTFLPPVMRVMRWLFIFLVVVGLAIVVMGTLELILIKTFSPTTVPLLLGISLAFLAASTFWYAIRVRRVRKRKPEIEAALKGLGSLDKDALRVASGLLPKLQRGGPFKRLSAFRKLVAAASEHPLVANGRDLQRDLFGPLSLLAIYGGIAALVLFFAFVPLAIAAVAA